MKLVVTPQTTGGLQRKLRAGNAGDTMQLWDCTAEGEELLAEIELVRVASNTVTLRIWAPDQVAIRSAKQKARRDVGGSTAEISEAHSVDGTLLLAAVASA